MADLQLRCSFCGKPKSAVKQFISGTSAFICNECVVLCNTILAHEEAVDAAWVADSPDAVQVVAHEFRRISDDPARPNRSFPSGD